jgi:hypothetical protein
LRHCSIRPRTTANLAKLLILSINIIHGQHHQVFPQSNPHPTNNVVSAFGKDWGKSKKLLVDATTRIC